MTEPKPKTDADYREEAKSWLQNYEACVRGRKYELAHKLIHKHASCFGLDAGFCLGRMEIEKQEWLQVWPQHEAFSFDMASASICPGEWVTTIAILWTARGLIAGSESKTGRATFCLGHFENNKVLCVHFHISKKP